MIRAFFGFLGFLVSDLADGFVERPGEPLLDLGRVLEFQVRSEGCVGTGDECVADGTDSLTRMFIFISSFPAAPFLYLRLFPFNFPFNTPEHLNVTTLLASMVRSLPGLGVPASSRVLVLYLEFTETGDQDIFAGFNRSFEYFQDGFHGLIRRLPWRCRSCCEDMVYEVGFGDGHCFLIILPLQRFMWFGFSVSIAKPVLLLQHLFKLEAPEHILSPLSIFSFDK